MTIKQFIERLEKYPPEMVVVVPGWDHSSRVPSLFVDKDKYKGHTRQVLVIE